MCCTLSSAAWISSLLMAGRGFAPEICYKGYPPTKILPRPVMVGGDLPCSSREWGGTGQSVHSFPYSNQCLHNPRRRQHSLAKRLPSWQWLRFELCVESRASWVPHGIWRGGKSLLIQGHLVSAPSSVVPSVTLYIPGKNPLTPIFIICI